MCIKIHNLRQFINLKTDIKLAQMERPTEFHETFLSLLKHQDFKGAEEYLAKPRSEKCKSQRSTF